MLNIYHECKRESNPLIKYPIKQSISFDDYYSIYKFRIKRVTFEASHWFHQFECQGHSYTN